MHRVLHLLGGAGFLPSTAPPYVNAFNVHIVHTTCHRINCSNWVPIQGGSRKLLGGRKQPTPLKWTHFDYSQQTMASMAKVGNLSQLIFQAPSSPWLHGHPQQSLTSLGPTQIPQQKPTRTTRSTLNTPPFSIDHLLSQIFPAKKQNTHTHNICWMCFFWNGFTL